MGLHDFREDVDQQRYFWPERFLATWMQSGVTSSVWKFRSCALYGTSWRSPPSDFLTTGRDISFPHKSWPSVQMALPAWLIQTSIYALFDTSRTSTLQVEVQDHDDSHDTRWCGQFNVLRCYLSGCQKSATHCSRRTNPPNFNQRFLTAGFKSSGQSYVDVRCCLARNGRSWSVRLDRPYNPCHSTGRSCVITDNLFRSNSNCKVIVNVTHSPVTSSVQIDVRFEFGSQGYSQCGVPETGASNVWKLSYEAKRHLLLAVALQRCKRSLAVDTLNA
ncbi:uncharacterized protein LACBIDRAFT_318448 [Laccaria bicolor S238N-H82]|uniref:Predicted protein n=1 Tax=Laccaria bicolor (strain S238N-H82 / ATCC MYA-4686) TaxID=486041 RepID=B0E2H3_LACBS|nr:uncharacterized protein LACBIDRAFT_318448 [Laccaria bicolor S238N-H82]EDQ98957.1 predicted protein [Laccaria bicolor S238N-H82]|eukprot:XP_001890390.1 predicted protein [Laccaria bicolor S238N-H82]